MGSDWKEVTLSEVCEIRRGSSPRPIVNFISETEGMPWIKIADATASNSRFIRSTKQFIKEEGVSRSVIVTKGDLILSNSGTAGLPIFVHITACIHDGWQVFKKLHGITKEYLYYALIHLRPALLHNAYDSTMKNLTLDMVRDAKIKLPPLTEQAEIVQTLVSLDDKIELNRQTNQTLEQMAQALFKSWFVDFDPVIDNALAAGNPIPDELQEHAQRRQQQLAKPDHKPLPDDIRQLFPSEFELTEALGWVPKGWVVKPLDEIAHYQNGLALQKFRPEDEKHFLPVLKIAHLKQGFTDGKEKASPNIKPSCIVDDGDVVFSWSGSLMVDIWCGGKAALNQHLFRVTSEVYPRWFYYYLTVHHLVEFQRIAADKAVTMGHIKREHLSQAKCAVPPLSFLDSVGGNVGSIINKQVLLRQQSTELSKLRDTLLPKLISGELRLPSEALADAEQQPANAIV